jgi:MATE family multidrug resistance protein
MTTDQVLNTIPFGIGVATSSRVGNLLGARDARGAARAANTAAILSITLGSIVMAVMLIVKDSYAKIFSHDMDVVRLTAKVMPLVALFQVADGLNGSVPHFHCYINLSGVHADKWRILGSCGGALRGMGRQHTGAAVNLVSYYFGALPLGIWLAFHGYGLVGLWVGQCIALYLVGAIMWSLVGFSNWDEQVKKAFDRMEADDRMEQGGI